MHDVYIVTPSKGPAYATDTSGLRELLEEVDFNYVVDMRSSSWMHPYGEVFVERLPWRASRERVAP